MTWNQPLPLGSFPFGIGIGIGIGIGLALAFVAAGRILFNDRFPSLRVRPEVRFGLQSTLISN